LITCFNRAKNPTFVVKVLKLGIGSSVILTISIASVLLLSSSSGIFNEKAYAGRDVVPIPQFGDFKCWKPTTTLATISSSLTLIDQFGTLDARAGVQFDLEQREYCTAADKFINGIGGLPDSNFDSPFNGVSLAQHFQGWRITNVGELNADPATGTRINVKVPQFGHDYDITLGAPYEILVPAAKLHSAYPGGQIDSVDTDIHWKCYMTSDTNPMLAAGGPVILTTQHELQFDTVGTPFLFCTPVVKIHDGVVNGLGNDQIVDHMACYDLTGGSIPADQPNIAQPLPTSLSDQFGVNQVSNLQLEKLCAPAFKSCPTGSGGVLPECSPLIAGSMTTIDSTMVLVAGAQGMLSWIVPVVVAGVGFVIVISRKLR